MCIRLYQIGVCTLMLARLLRLLAIYVELKHFIRKLLQTIKQVNLKSFNISKNPIKNQ
jgi:hypothetical protein